MHAKLEAALAELMGLLDEAQERLDNAEGDKALERYTNIVDNLHTAVDSVEQATGEFE